MQALIIYSDPDILDHTGCEVATLGEQLEGIFGRKARTSGDGVLPILERGQPFVLLYLSTVAAVS